MSRYRYNELLPFWPCFKAYWCFNKGKGVWWLRTPLFVIGHYNRGEKQDSCAFYTGWDISWIPTRWSFRFYPGSLLYKYQWDNLRIVGYPDSELEAQQIMDNYVVEFDENTKEV